MMNVVVLGLVLSSLAAASVWSPQPEKHAAVLDGQRAERPESDATVYREGHRVIVVEYERQSPQRPPFQDGAVEETKEKLKEAASVLPNLGQGVSVRDGGKEVKEELKAPGHGAKERICDAYGVCKDKISGLLGRPREKVAQFEEAAKEAVTRTVEKARAVKEEISDNVSSIADQALGKAKSAAGRAKESGGDVIEKGQELERDLIEKAKEMERDAVERAKEVKRKAAEKAREVQVTTADKATEVRKNLTDILQRAREVACDAAAYMGLKRAGDALAVVLHLLGFATAYGSCVWVTFVSSHVLAQALPRHLFGVLQSKLYPVYFRVMAYSIGVSLLSHAFGPAGRRQSATEKFQGYVLLSSLVPVLLNMLFLEPKATKVMYERMKMEKEEGRGRDMADVGLETTTTRTTAQATATPPTGTARVAATGLRVEEASAEEAATKCKMTMLNRRLRRLNSCSSLLNVMTLMGLTWHLAHLSWVLQEAAC